MEGHAKKCVERYCELANKTTQQLYKVSTPCIDDHHFEEEEMESVGELSKVCSQLVLKCLYLARIGMVFVGWLGRGNTTLHCIHHVLTCMLKSEHLFLFVLDVFSYMMSFGKCSFSPRALLRMPCASVCRDVSMGSALIRR